MRSMFGKQNRLSLEITPERFRLIQLQVTRSHLKLLKALDVERRARAESGSARATEAEEFRELLRSNGIRATDVRVLFDGGPMSITTLSLSQSELENASENEQWYANQYSPIPGDKALLNFRIWDGQGKGSAPVVLVVTDKRKVTDVLELLKAASVKVRRMDIVPFALERLFLNMPESRDEKTTAVVGLREENTSVLVRRNGQVDFVRCFRMFPEMSAGSFVERMRQTFQSYGDWHPLNIIERVCFCRMTELFPDVESKLQESTGIEVAELDLMSNIVFEQGETTVGPDQVRLTSLAALIGAAL